MNYSSLDTVTPVKEQVFSREDPPDRHPKIWSNEGSKHISAQKTLLQGQMSPHRFRTGLSECQLRSSLHPATGGEKTALEELGPADASSGHREVPGFHTASLPSRRPRATYSPFRVPGFQRSACVSPTPKDHRVTED